MEILFELYLSLGFTNIVGIQSDFVLYSVALKTSIRAEAKKFVTVQEKIRQIIRTLAHFLGKREEKIYRYSLCSKLSV